jgi:hypothetical protein
MRHLVTQPLCLALFAALAFGLAPVGVAEAGQGHDITVAANDGYGLQECLGEGGQAVADAWCAAEGRGAALSFGRAQTVEAAYVVTCGD